MATVSFPYKYVGDTSFGPLFRPRAKVIFTSPKNNLQIAVWMVVDSGADYSILPKLVADEMGISFADDCVTDSTAGVGGGQTVYFLKQKITASLGLISLEVPISFMDSNSIPPLLGRLGFLEEFEVTFKKDKTVIFKS